jgi:hypothetical protein
MLSLHRSFAVAALLLFATFAHAQHIAAISVSNYAGINSVHLNPALNGYSKYNWHINLVGAWANANNNYLTLKLPYSAYRLLRDDVPYVYLTENGNPEFREEWLKENTSSNRKHMNASASVFGPSFMVKVKSWTLGMVSSAHAFGRANGVSRNLAHAAFMGFDTARGAFTYFDKDRTIQPFTVSANSYAALGGTAAKSIKLKWNQELIAGVTLKKIWGFGGSYFQTGPLSVTYADEDSIAWSAADMKFSDYSSNRGKGMGADLGLVYVYHDKEFRQGGGYKDKHPWYKYKLGISVLDIGRIKYPDAFQARIANTEPSGIRYSNGDQSQSDPQGASGNYMSSLFERMPGYYTTTVTETIGLPTRLALTADHQFSRYHFISAQVVQSLRSRQSVHMRQASYAMIAPRYERKYFEFSLPVLLEYDYSALRVGASMRLGPLYLGTNSLMSFLYTRHIKDADFYIGITISDITGWKFSSLWKRYRFEDDKDKERKGVTNDKCGGF